MGGHRQVDPGRRGGGSGRGARRGRTPAGRGVRAASRRRRARRSRARVLRVGGRASPHPRGEEPPRRAGLSPPARRLYRSLVLICTTCGRENAADARFCNACGTALEGVSEYEVRKTVTVMFTDVSGSTALGERLDPESFRRVMARYFDVSRQCVERHGGTVEKFIGDAVMAVFGVPTVHEDDALRAPRAAAELREALAALNEELERDYGVALELRTGVN